MVDADDIAEVAADKLMRILADAARTAEKRVAAELSPAELAALRAGPMPKVPTAGTMEEFFWHALAGGYGPPGH